MVRSFKAFEHIDNNFGASLGGKVVQQSVDGVNTATAVTASLALPVQSIAIV
jgi:hypothetical protein